VAEPLILRPSLKRWGGLFAGSVAFLLGGLWLAGPVHEPVVGALTALFGLVGAVMSAIAVWPGASRLVLDDNGMVIRNPFRSERRYRWDEILETAIFSIEGVDMVVFRLPPGHPDHGERLARWNGGMTGGFAGYLPDTYGMTATALQDLLHAYIKRAGTAAR
jgi:hypothetical protein